MEERKKLVLEYVGLCASCTLEPGDEGNSLRIVQIEKELKLSKEEILEEGQKLLLSPGAGH